MDWPLSNGFTTATGPAPTGRRAIELNPNIGAIHSHYSIFLSVIGKLDEAIAEGTRALKLDPLSIQLHRNQAARFYLAAGATTMLEQYGEALELDSQDATLHDVYEQMGQRRDAIAEWTRAATGKR